MKRSLLATRAFVTEAHVDASPASVLSALEDLDAFMRLNPLVTNVERDPRDADTYIVTDRLRILGISIHIRYRTRILRVADGLDVEVRASLATHLHNELRVLGAGTGARIVESVRLTAPWPLASYSAATAKAAHREYIERLKAIIEAREAGRVRTHSGSAPRPPRS